MKIALIADTHFGVRGDAQLFHDNNKKFLDNIFFPFLKDNNIENLIHLGDLVDRRKYINFQTANKLRTDFLEPLCNQNINTYIIAGNHDTYYKNTNEINALTELVGVKYNNIKLYWQPTTIELDIPILLLPWICDDNREESFKAIGSTNAQICMSHLELVGYHMYKGHIATEGDDPKRFEKFDMVFSGHYHHKSSSGNIYYLGSHSEFIWSDYDDPRGFHVFDTSTRELTFIENPYKIFKKIWYDDNSSYNLDNLSSSIVKVIIKNKNDPYHFDKFMEHIEKQNPVEVQIVEDHLNLNLEEDKNIVNEAESTIDIFKKYINKSEIPNVDKNKLENEMINLYNEALSI